MSPDGPVGTLTINQHDANASAQVPVPVVNVWVVRVLVREHLVLMGVDVRLPAIPWKVMRVQVVRVVRVTVSVGQWLMRMVVLMAFLDVQPHTEGHQRCSGPEK